MIGAIDGDAGSRATAFFTSAALSSSRDSKTFNAFPVILSTVFPLRASQAESTRKRARRSGRTALFFAPVS